MTEFCILGLEFKNIIVIFVSALEFVFSLSLVQKKKKNFKFGTNNILFGFAKAGIWNQKHRICLIAKRRETKKMPKFGTKEASYGFFYYNLFKKLLSCLKSAHLNLSNCKISQKNKNV